MSHHKPGSAICFLFLVSAALEVRATVACPVPCMVRQPDRTVIAVYLRGDEFCHWNEEVNGYTILQAADDGPWVYAAPDDAGNLAPTEAVVGRDDPEQMGLKRHLRPARAGRREEQGRAGTGEEGGNRVIREGVMKNLVLLVDFPDKRHTIGRGAFGSLFNAKGYKVDGAAGSVRDYFREVSYQKLTVDSVVVDWIMMDHGYAYYGADQGGSGRDIRPRQMVAEALAKLEARGFDFSTVDGDNDGEVDALTVIHAGGGQEFSMNDTKDIWSHQWELVTTVEYDGRRMRKYHTEAELRGLEKNPGTQGITRIGVICHETGHFLGLPDLYDLGFDSRGVGNFCVMGGGCWNGNAGTLPAHMSAWCKATLKWVTPVEVEASRTYRVPRVEDTPRLFRMRGGFPSSEYFLVENRQGVGFDAGLPGKRRGLLIWHVDESVDNNDNPNHYKVDLEEAGGTQDLELNLNGGADSDYFRNKTMKTFNADTAPDNRSYSGEPLGLNITDVSKPSAKMTFTVQP